MAPMPTATPGLATAPRLAFASVLAALLLAGCAGQSRAPAVNSNGPGDPPPAVRNTTQPQQTLDQMLQQDDFDLPRALLLFSEKFYPEFSGKQRHDLDVEAKLARFETYTNDLRAALRRDKTPRTRLRTLIEFVHVKLGLRFDSTDPNGAKADNLFFDRVLQNRTGYCVTLSLAYIVFGQAAGLDVVGIRVPTHFTVRFRDTEADGQPYETLVETTASGETQDDTYYWAKYRFSTTSVQNGVYLTPLTDKQIFGTIFNNLAGLTHLRGNNELAVDRYTRALELAPNNAEALYNRALVARMLQRDKDALKDFNAAIRLDPNFVYCYLARARLLFDSGERAQAKEDLGEAMRKRPEWPEPHMMNGIFLSREGDLEAAKAAFLHVLELDKGFNAARIAIAELERARGNEREARQWEAEAGIR